MTTQIKRRRGTTLQHSTFAGAEAEITIDTDKNTVVVHDGSTAGGHPLAKASEVVAKAGDTMTGNLDVTGTITSDGLTVDGASNLAASVSNTTDTAAYHGLKINTANTSSLTYPLYVRSNNLDRLVVQGNGDISFYDAAGVSQSLFWDASLEALGVGITPSTAMHVYSGSGNTALRVETGLTNGQAEINFKNDARRYNVGINSSDNLHFVDDTAGATRMTIDSSGNVGIGTSSPSAKLQVAGNTQFGAVGTDGAVQFLRSSDGGAVASVAFQSGTSEVKLNNAISGPMTFYTNNTERMRIDSSGRVGIGTSSPSAELHINDATGLSRIRLTGGAAGADNFEIGQGTTGISNSNFEIYDIDAAATRMVIDSSGNLLVGKTSVGLSGEGSYFQADGAIVGTRDPYLTTDAVFYVNRLVDDGNLVNFYKDGTTVGSIGSRAGGGINVNSQTGSLGLQVAGANTMFVGSTELFGGTDATIDLGINTNRFKDLYLSGGVYLGGITSDNLLDDYEEGTFTPVLSGYTGVTGTLEGKYVKIGRMVFCHVYMNITALSYSGNTRITGWPFTPSNTVSNHVPHGTIGTGTALNVDPYLYHMAFYNQTENMYLYNRDTGSALSGDNYQVGILGINVVYQAS